MPKIGEDIFYKKYKTHLFEQSDKVILFYAEHLKSAKYKLELLEKLENKNWWYFKYKGEAYIHIDPAESMKVLDKGFEQVPANYFAHICAIWAKNVVFNDLVPYLKKSGKLLPSSIGTAAQRWLALYGQIIDLAYHAPK